VPKLGDVLRELASVPAGAVILVRLFAGYSAPLVALWPGRWPASRSALLRASTRGNVGAVSSTR
jgi:hypothetical protein